MGVVVDNARRNERQAERLVFCERMGLSERRGPRSSMLRDNVAEVVACGWRFVHDAIFVSQRTRQVLWGRLVGQSRVCICGMIDFVWRSSQMQTHIAMLWHSRFVGLSVCLFVCSSVWLCVCLSVCLFVPHPSDWGC